MKTRIAIIVVALLMGGCATSPFKKLDSHIPDGQWDQADVKIVGEIVNAKLTATGTKKDGKWVEAEIHGTYHGYFVKELTLDLKKKKVE